MEGENKGGTWESAGVGFLISQQTKQALTDVYQISSIICTITVAAAGRHMSPTSAYAPQSLRPMSEKEQLHRELANELEQHKREVRIALGDFNARLHCRAETEHQI